MQKNELNRPKAEKKKKRKNKGPKGESKVGLALRSILDGSILTRENAIRLLPFILFLTLICVLFIANSYYAEKTVISTDAIRRDIKKLENEYISTKSELMICSKQSELAAILDSTGVVESLEPPKKIFVKPDLMH
jgi:hypothetical protein